MRSLLFMVCAAMALGSMAQTQSGSPSLQNEVEFDPYREQQLREPYVAFLNTLNPGKIESDFAGAVRNLRSPNPLEQRKGLQVLGASDEIDAIALIVPLLDSEHSIVRIYAGLALENIVSVNELRRRDPKHPDKIIFLPRSSDDVDLRPLAWVVLKMLRVDEDGSTASYAAMMAGYLGLSEFTGELKKLLKSRHPSVQNSATQALLVLKNNAISQ